LGAPISAEATDIAILPFANHSRTIDAVELMLPLVVSGLQARGLEVRETSDLRPLLRRKRIRAIGMISEEDARVLAEELGVPLLLLGSFDLLVREDPPEAGLSLRILDARTLRIRGATSVARSGEDYAGAFGVGRVHDLGELASRVVEEALDELEHDLLGSAPVSPPARPCETLALVPFDDVSELGRGGDVITFLLLSALVRAHYSVVEPGFVREAFLARGVIRQGEIDQDSLALLQKRYGVCFAVTGVVSRFKPARGNLELAVPELAYGARLIDPRNAEVMGAWNEEHDGAETEGLFGTGRTHSIGALGNRAMQRLVERIDEIVGRRESGP
jgi:hypothetical protein